MCVLEQASLKTSREKRNSPSDLNKHTARLAEELAEELAAQVM